jgi:hypothetical protein
MYFGIGQAETRIAQASFSINSTWYDELVQANVSCISTRLFTRKPVRTHLIVSTTSLAHVAGTQEPEYGPSAIQPVTTQAETVPFTELTLNDLKWKAMESTCVETQTFYFMSNEGTFGMAQVIYSNVG